MAAYIIQVIRLVPLILVARVTRSLNPFLQGVRDFICLTLVLVGGWWDIYESKSSMKK